jgi:phosphotriesterase-related protein
LDDLGFTLIHEHLLFQFNPVFRQKAIDFVRTELLKYYNYGGRTLVDLTPFRHIDWYTEIAAGLAVNIVCCTGYYLKDWIPEPDLVLPQETLTARMCAEITDGIVGSAVRAGIIKVAADNVDLDPWERKVFCAAAKAQQRTGTPIATHACRGARDQQRVLLDAGADPAGIFFSHVEAEFGWEGRNVREEAKYLGEIVARGSRLLFNNFGFDFDTSLENLVFLIKALSDQGYQDQILISIDMNFQIDASGKIILEAADRHPECAERVYSYVFDAVIPVLEREGFSGSEIRRFFIDNPADFFRFK